MRGRLSGNHSPPSRVRLIEPEREEAMKALRSQLQFLLIVLAA